MLYSRAASSRSHFCRPLLLKGVGFWPGEGLRPELTGERTRKAVSRLYFNAPDGEEQSSFFTTIQRGAKLLDESHELRRIRFHADLFCNGHPVLGVRGHRRLPLMEVSGYLRFQTESEQYRTSPFKGQHGAVDFPQKDG
jgi:hypothetical protein